MSWREKLHWILMGASTIATSAPLRSSSGNPSATNAEAAVTKN